VAHSKQCRLIERFAVELDAHWKHRWDGRETAGLHDRRNPHHVAEVEGIGLWCGCRLGRGAGKRGIVVQPRAGFDGGTAMTSHTSTAQRISSINTVHSRSALM
jgi:hypothetical protein